MGSNSSFQVQVRKIKMRYYHIHAIIALGISVAMYLIPEGALLSGGLFYLSREIRDAEKLNYWDYQGFIWPMMVTFLLWGLILIYF